MNANDRLNAMQARCDAASPAPWDYAGQGWVRHGDMTIGSDQFPEVLAATTSTDADGVFIAAARTDLPATIAALRDFTGRHHEVAQVWGGVECSCGRDRYCPDLAILRKFGEALT